MLNSQICSHCHSDYLIVKISRCELAEESLKLGFTAQVGTSNLAEYNGL
jgi:hypothetical protein